MSGSVDPHEAESEPASEPRLSDVRMRGFARRDTVETAIQWIDDAAAQLSSEEISLVDAHRRVLATTIHSQVNVPGFRRAMMDGFAVQAADTTGASSYSPLPLELAGTILPGQTPGVSVQQGTAIRIMTGAPLPAGADAVLPVEKTLNRDQQLMAIEAVSPGKHVGEVGEDIATGTELLTAGRRLRPQDLGVLSSVGVGQLSVVRRPRVRVVITGNELLASGEKPSGNQITDANGPMLAALIQRDGGVLSSREIIEDRPDAILAAMQDAVDIVIVSGGSSVGQEDFAPSLLREHGELSYHGIAMRPSSPSGMGRLDERLVFLLPGNPVSCLCSYDFFAGRAIRRLAGLNNDWPYPRRTARLGRKITSQIGRVDYARIRFDDEGRVEPIAISGASLLSSTTFADGFILIPANHEGYPPGTEVEVLLYDV